MSGWQPKRVRACHAGMMGDDQGGASCRLPNARPTRAATVRERTTTSQRGLIRGCHAVARSLTVAARTMGGSMGAHISVSPYGRRAVRPKLTHRPQMDHRELQWRRPNPMTQQELRLDRPAPTAGHFGAFRGHFGTFWGIPAHSCAFWSTRFDARQALSAVPHRGFRNPHAPTFRHKGTYDELSSRNTRRINTPFSGGFQGVIGGFSPGYHPIITRLSPGFRAAAGRSPPVHAATDGRIKNPIARGGCGRYNRATLTDMEQ